MANSGNKTNVVEAVAKACRKYGIGLGLYYSLWDRKVNGNVKDTAQDVAYTHLYDSTVRRVDGHNEKACSAR